MNDRVKSEFTDLQKFGQFELKVLYLDCSRRIKTHRATYIVRCLNHKIPSRHTGNKSRRKPYTLYIITNKATNDMTNIYRKVTVRTKPIKNNRRSVEPTDLRLNA